ncbi:MAG TPA: hypothetical protein VG711_06990 [Phycisphaerales bacterium]|nr:hypothetical protein [Phycisphaerales bacterium]
MSIIGSPIETSVVLALQAQQQAAKNRDRDKAAASDSARRFNDLVELRVAGVEDERAIRALPQNDSQQSQTEHESHENPAPPPEDQPHIDLKA